MRSMLLEKITDLKSDKQPLRPAAMAIPEPGAGEVLIKISACAVCHTELDEIEGRTPPPRFPVIPGHQAVGQIFASGKSAHRFSHGDRVGVAWIYSACGQCEFCRAGNENLCPEFRATGRDAHGGYAEYMVVREDFAYKIPDFFTDAEAAPLLCAGAIGYRSLALTDLRNGQNLGLTGFGASGHLVLKMAAHRFPDSKVYVFARSETEQQFARELGAAWAGDTLATTPDQLNAIIDTTPVWQPVVSGLKNLKPGGRMVINAIRKEESDKNALLGLNYPEHLWLEKEIKSVANVTRRDVEEFLNLAAEMKIRPEYQEYDLADANQALIELKERGIRGAKVLRI